MFSFASGHANEKKILKRPPMLFKIACLYYKTFYYGFAVKRGFHNIVICVEPNQ